MTQIINSIAVWRELRRTAAFRSKTLGFVPTMGNLHAGHQSLLQRSVQENQLSVLSIFVNPTQFNDPNDLANYPRTLAQDLAMAQEVGIDYVLVPECEQLYADDYRYKVSENSFSRLLCGQSRPGHFDGVLTIVLKLLLLVKADKAYFGEKDYQQLTLITDMCQAFFIDTEVVPCPTVRTAAGLALSSRNNLLSAQAKELAPLFYTLLSSALTIPEIKQALSAKGFIIDYIEEYAGRRFGAVKLDNVRLIDNISLDRLDASINKVE